MDKLQACHSESIVGYSNADHTVAPMTLLHETMLENKSIAEDFATSFKLVRLL